MTAEEMIKLLRPLTAPPYPGEVQERAVDAILLIEAMAQRLNQYRNDMVFPPAVDSRERRVPWINEVIGDNGLRVKR